MPRDAHEQCVQGGHTLIVLAARCAQAIEPQLG
jgi:hypothetical protein